METTKDCSVRSLTALLLVQALIACGPPPEPALPKVAGDTPSASAEPATKPAALPSCGASWCVIAGLPKQVTFSAVWGSSPTDVWLAGEAGTLLHWNGSTWSAAASGTQSALRALGGTSAKDVWAAGLDGTLLHFDGSSWSAQQKSGAPWSPASGPNERPIYALLALPNQLWVGGSGSRSFDGKTWTEPHHGSHLPTMALWGLQSSSLWEVGLQGMVNRWDGHHWQRIGGESGPNFFGVWGSAANDVWVVGSGGSIAHFRGEKPTIVSSGTTNDLHAVRGFAENDVWAVGDQGTILHWQGSLWAPFDSPSPSALLSVWGTSARDVWIVGENGAVLHHQI
jgi:hypothetical protein